MTLVIFRRGGMIREAKEADFPANTCALWGLRCVVMIPHERISLHLTIKMFCTKCQTQSSVRDFQPTPWRSGDWLNHYHSAWKRAQQFLTVLSCYSSISGPMWLFILRDQCRHWFVFFHRFKESITAVVVGVWRLSGVTNSLRAWQTVGVAYKDCGKGSLRVEWTLKVTSKWTSVCLMTRLGIKMALSGQLCSFHKEQRT